MDWPIEPVHDEDWLYRRLAPHHIKRDGSVSSSAFMRSTDQSGRRREPDPDVSVDLARLTTPEESLRCAGRPQHGIGALQAREPRRMGLTVVHSPLPENRAHASIRGNQGAEGYPRCHALAAILSRNIVIRPRALP